MDPQAARRAPRGRRQAPRGQPLAAGANLEDLAFVARTAQGKVARQQSGADNDPSDGFDDRYLKLGTTIDNAGRVNGDLTPECTAALQAVLDALGKKAGAEDQRTEPQAVPRRPPAGLRAADPRPDGA